MTVSWLWAEGVAVVKRRLSRCSAWIPRTIRGQQTPFGDASDSNNCTAKMKKYYFLYVEIQVILNNDSFESQNYKWYLIIKIKFSFGLLTMTQFSEWTNLTGPLDFLWEQWKTMAPLTASTRYRFKKLETAIKVKDKIIRCWNYVYQFSPSF